MISRKKAEGLFHSDVGLPWIAEIAKRYFNVSLCIARTAKDAATRRASWVRAVLAESQVNMSSQILFNLSQEFQHKNLKHQVHDKSLTTR